MVAESYIQMYPRRQQGKQAQRRMNDTFMKNVLCLALFLQGSWGSHSLFTVNLIFTTPRQCWKEKFIQDLGNQSIWTQISLIIILPKLKIFVYLLCLEWKNPPSPLKVLCSCTDIYLQMTCESHCVEWEHFIWSQIKNTSFLSLPTISANFFNYSCSGS